MSFYPNTDAPFSLLAPITSQIKLMTEFIMMAWETPIKEAAMTSVKTASVSGFKYSIREAAIEKATPITNVLFFPTLDETVRVLAEVTMEQM